MPVLADGWTSWMSTDQIPPKFNLVRIG